MTFRPPVQTGQLYRDLAPDMFDRKRLLRVVELDLPHAVVQVEHDFNGTVGQVKRIRAARLRSSVFELAEDPVEADPMYHALLRAMAEVHEVGATPAEYAQAALHTFRALHGKE